MSHRPGSFLLTVAAIGILYSPTSVAQWSQECVEAECLEGPAIFDCCFPDGSCSTVDGTGRCYTGKTHGLDTCAGDGNGDGIDDGCGCSTLATACCLPDGGCAGPLPPSECEAVGGVSLGGPCGSCAGVSCPVPGCIGATGSCFQPHDTPGCDDLYCCDQICSENPECCELPARVPSTSTTAIGILAVVLFVLGAYAIGRRLR